MNAFKLISIIYMQGHKILGAFHLEFSKGKNEIGGVPDDVLTSIIIGIMSLSSQRSIDFKQY